MLGTSILSNKNTLSRNTQRIFIHLVLHLAANRTAFCTKLRCVLHQNALRFAPNCTAFCTKLHRVLHQIALRFAPKYGVFCCKQHTFMLSLQFYAIPKALPVLIDNRHFAQKERSRESIICAQVNVW